MTLAPIVLLVYNRPTHTKLTLQALSENALADQSLLYVFADGLKPSASEYDKRKIAEVEQVVKSRKWCKEVFFVKRDTNIGLADNIIDGVTEVVNKYGKVIVLEDDVVTSSGFLKYMNDALTLYSHDDAVMHVSGYMFPVEKKLPPTFFYNTASCWGWATWARAWKYFNRDAIGLMAQFVRKEQIKKFNIEDTYPFFDHLKLNASRSIKTWAVRWYASMFIKNGFSLHCYPSLVNNIGNDGGGASGGNTSLFTWSTLADQIPVHKIPIQESATARKEMMRFNKNLMKDTKGWQRKFKPYAVQLIKLLLPPIVLKALKQAQPVNAEKKKIDAVRKIARYQIGYTDLLGDSLKFIDSASFEFIFDEIFKKEIYKFSTPNSSPLIIDGGANIGLSVIYFKRLYPEAKIVAFEPDKQAFDALSYNVRSFKLKNIELFQKALWDSETTLKFYSEGADGGRIATSTDNEKLIDTPTIRLVDFLKQKIDFLKLDIEGAETKVLEDCAGYLSYVERMFVEYHSFRNKTQDLHRLLQILVEAGFRYNIHHIGVHSPQPFLNVSDYEGMDLQLNIYAFRI